MSENQEVAPRQRGMTPVRMTLAAGVPRSIVIAGDYIHMLTAPVNDLVVRFDNGEPVPMYESVGFRRYYSELEFESDTGQSIVVLAGFGSVADGRASANVNVTTSLEPGNTINDGGDVVCAHGAATQLLAADPNRLYALIVNPSTNTLTMRIGSATVDGTSGVPIEPGTSLPYPSTAAIYAYNGDAALDETLSAASVQQV